MRGLAYNPDILPAELIIRMKFKPMPIAPSYGGHLTNCTTN
ncbi:DUF2737 family protein [Salmonella enterica subsp. enterica]|nr:DUF2737 family protein [Salmonella enterica subsp. enterica]